MRDYYKANCVTLPLYYSIQNCKTVIREMAVHCALFVCLLFRLVNVSLLDTKKVQREVTNRQLELATHKPKVDRSSPASALRSCTMCPSMAHHCTELLKLTSPSLWNLTVDSAAKFFQIFSTKASFNRNEDFWLKSLNL